MWYGITLLSLQHVNVYNEIVQTPSKYIQPKTKWHGMGWVLFKSIASKIHQFIGTFNALDKHHFFSNTWTGGRLWSWKKFIYKNIKARMDIAIGPCVQLFWESLCFKVRTEARTEREIYQEKTLQWWQEARRDLNLYWLFPPGEEESRLWRLLSGAPLFNQTIIEGPQTGSHSYQQRALSPQSRSYDDLCLRLG